MDVSEERLPGARLLGFPQRIDATNAKVLEDRILGIIDAGERHLVLDLSRLEYLSSAGLRVFMLVSKRVRTADGKLALFGLTDHVQQVFDIAGFGSILRIHPSRTEAIEDVASI